MQDLRRFAALRRRLNALQQESYTVGRVLEVTDWRGEHTAEVQASTLKLTTLDDEIADIEYLLDYYERSMTQAQSLIVSPQTVALITAIVLAVFVLMTMVAGVLAGAINVR
jgi:hypothetical protein